MNTKPKSKSGRKPLSPDGVVPVTVRLPRPWLRWIDRLALDELCVTRAEAVRLVLARARKEAA